MPVRVFLRLLVLAVPFAVTIVGAQYALMRDHWRFGVFSVAIAFPALIALTPREWRGTAIRCASAFSGLSLLRGVTEPALRYWVGDAQAIARPWYVPLWVALTIGVLLLATPLLGARKAT